MNTEDGKLHFVYNIPHMYMNVNVYANAKHGLERPREMIIMKCIQLVCQLMLFALVSN